MQTIEAIIDPNGNIRPLEPINIAETRRAIITILDAEESAVTKLSHEELEAAYIQMAQDEEREREAHEWAEAMIGDVSDETR